MYIIVAYDISNNRFRNSLAKELLQFGIRTQKSIFECEVSEKELNIIRKIAKKYSQNGDFVAIYMSNKNKIKREGKVDMLEIEHLVF